MNTSANEVMSFYHKQMDKQDTVYFYMYYAFWLTSNYDCTSAASVYVNGDRA